MDYFPTWPSAPLRLQHLSVCCWDSPVIGYLPEHESRKTTCLWRLGTGKRHDDRQCILFGNAWEHSDWPTRCNVSCISPSTRELSITVGLATAYMSPTTCLTSSAHAWFLFVTSITPRRSATQRFEGPSWSKLLRVVRHVDRSQQVA